MSKDNKKPQDPHEYIQDFAKVRKGIEKMLSKKFDPYQALIMKVSNILKEILDEADQLPKTKDKKKWILKEFEKRYDKKIMGIWK